MALLLLLLVACGRGPTHPSEASSASLSGRFEGEGLCLALHPNRDFELSLMPTGTGKVLFLGSAVVDGPKLALTVPDLGVGDGRVHGPAPADRVSVVHVDQPRVARAAVLTPGPDQRLSNSDTVPIGSVECVLVALPPTPIYPYA